MQFNEYQEHTARTSKGGLTHEMRIANAVFGLAGEFGEVVELLKKHLFHGHVLDKDKLKLELSDCLWYIAYMCRIFDFKLEDVAIANIEKLKARYPDGFTTDLSVNRKPEDV